MHALVATPGILAGALCLTACGYQQSLLHPTMAPPVAADIELSCEQIDLTIDRADTVRWVIRDDGGNLETSGEKAGRYAANTIIFPLTAMAYFPTLFRDGGSKVLAAVDLRLLKLLQLKRDRRCPARPTTVAGVDDIALTGELEAIQARIDSDDGEQAELLDEKSRLLDGLRVVPPPTATAPAAAPRY